MKFVYETHSPQRRAHASVLCAQLGPKNAQRRTKMAATNIDSRGVSRGRCVFPGCACSCYSREPSGKCASCTHPPAKHLNLNSAQAGMLCTVCPTSPLWGHMGTWWGFVKVNVYFALTLGQNSSVLCHNCPELRRIAQKMEQRCIILGKRACVHALNFDRKSSLNPTHRACFRGNNPRPLPHSVPIGGRWGIQLIGALVSCCCC